jgi:phosphosulfolactate phosphohydrolase-like enzyme
MRIERRRPVESSPQRADAVVVIDVLRMTSTAATLMRRPSCVRAAVAATLDDLARLPEPLSNCVIVSELSSAPARGAWVDNSPAQVAQMDFAERTPVLVTTNGTRTLLAAAQCSDQVVLASFVDLHAVARHLAPMESVVLMPAGKFASGEACIEDDLCADALEALLTGREPDLEAFAAIIRADPRIRRRVETERGFSADLDLALQGDPRAAVLIFKPIDEGVGHIARA